MNRWDTISAKLFAAARAIPRDDQVPYAFERRIMARLAGETAADMWELWARALVRAACFCVVVTLVLGAGSLLLPAARVESLPQAVEETIFAVVNNGTSQFGDFE